MLTLKKSDYEALRRHGEESYPHECCGALLGRFHGGGRIVEQVVRCTNTRADRPEDRYNIHPRELLSLQRQAAKQELDIVGFYHSHPDHPAQWSVTDLAEAHWLGCSYVITSVEKGRAALTNSFALEGESEENKRLEAEEISVLSSVEDPTPCH